MISITTKLGKFVVRTVYGDKYWTVITYDERGNSVEDFGMITSASYKEMGANHLKMLKKVLNKCSYFSALNKPIVFT